MRIKKQIVKVQRLGGMNHGSLGMTIPRDFADALNIESGDFLKVELEGGCFVVKKT